ncbi:MAG: 30S ribosomal protein S6e [archaeon]
MADFRFVINDVKTGKSFQKALNTEEVVGKKLGETLKGEFLGLEGYELTISGGSDSTGFPLRKDIEGTARKKGLFRKGVGMRKVTRKGIRRRKTVCGNTITEKTTQINLKVTKFGTKSLDEIFKKEEPKEDKKE